MPSTCSSGSSRSVVSRTGEGQPQQACHENKPPPPPLWSKVQGPEHEQDADALTRASERTTAACRTPALSRETCAGEAAICSKLRSLTTPKVPLAYQARRCPWITK